MRKKSSKTIHLTPEDNTRLLTLSGIYDKNIQYLEKNFDIKVISRGFAFKVKGKNIDICNKVLLLIKRLYNYTKTHKNLSENDIFLMIKDDLSFQQTTIKELYESISPNNKNQKLYINNMDKFDINFAIGPAGTGKTYLAVAFAIFALKTNQVKKIILTRPAIEAGENLGFLPGGLLEKTDPYLRPLYDALYAMLPAKEVSEMIAKNIIEIAPLAYMRGRTLDDAFIILDESQNTTTGQLKMFLTRLGFNSKAVITGDLTQIDLPYKTQSGLKQSLAVLKHITSIGYTFFEPADVCRHPIIGEIINAYNKYENPDLEH